MTELFKCLALFCAVSVAFGYMDVRDDATWFKNGSRIKNKFVTGVVNGIVDTDCNDVIDGEEVQGECLPKVECTKEGGIPGGLCSLMGSCCYLKKTCSQTTSAKISYFVHPNKYESPCTLKVKKYSPRVCQIRLDFEKFMTAPPTRRNITDQKAYECHDDKFSVDNRGKFLGFYYLCGNNSGQHIYIPVASDKQEISLRFDIKDRTTNPNLVKWEWKIKITQLECDHPVYENFLTAPSKLMALHNNLKNKKQSKCCHDLIAPPGCLQYYRNATGTFESFNFNNGIGPYIGRMDYAICIRKTPEICGVRYTAIEFQMGGTADDCHPKDITKPQDYIRISEGKYRNEFKDHYCADELKKGETVTAFPYEPLYVGVHTDDISGLDLTEAEFGFRIQYATETTDCEYF